MMGVFAEFERSIIQERVRAGLARAKSERKQLGRPRLDAALEKRIREALQRPEKPGVRSLSSTSASALAQCSGSAALSWRQASPCRAPKTAEMTQKRRWCDLGPHRCGPLPSAAPNVCGVIVGKLWAVAAGRGARADILVGVMIIGDPGWREVSKRLVWLCPRWSAARSARGPSSSDKTRASCDRLRNGRRPPPPPLA
jgi:hypothetical protein